MKLLFHIAQDYGIAVVVTNQVNTLHPCTISHKSNSTGGNIITYMSNYRICLRRRYAGDQVAATIVKSPYHLEKKANLILSEKGIEDA